MSLPFDAIGQAAGEVGAWMAWVKERQPGLADAVDEMAAKLAADLEEMFWPFQQLADDEITLDEFTAIMDERNRRDVAERFAMWSDYETTSPTGGRSWTVPCEDCGIDVEWESEDDEPPPHYPQCGPCEEAEQNPEPDDEELLEDMQRVVLDVPTGDVL